MPMNFKLLIYLLFEDLISQIHEPRKIPKWEVTGGRGGTWDQDRGFLRYGRKRCIEVKPFHFG